MHANRNATLSQSTPRTTLTKGSENGTSTQQTSQTAGKENNPSPGFRPITWPEPDNQLKESPQVTHSQDMALLEVQYYPRMDNSLADPCEHHGSGLSSKYCNYGDNTPCSAVSHTS